MQMTQIYDYLFLRIFFPLLCNWRFSYTQTDICTHKTHKFYSYMMMKATTKCTTTTSV